MPHHPIKKIHREAAISKVSLHIRLFLEANPGFAGEINVIIIHLQNDDLANADSKKLEQIALERKCLNVLRHEKIQTSARKRVFDFYRSVKKVEFNITENHVYAHITITKAEKQKSQK